MGVVYLYGLSLGVEVDEFVGHVADAAAEEAVEVVHDGGGVESEVDCGFHHGAAGVFLEVWEEVEHADDVGGALVFRPGHGGFLGGGG